MQMVPSYPNYPTLMTSINRLRGSDTPLQFPQPLDSLVYLLSSHHKIIESVVVWLSKVMETFHPISAPPILGPLLVISSHSLPTTTANEITDANLFTTMITTSLHPALHLFSTTTTTTSSLTPITHYN
jgi:hypothetical protein